jgi:hypothetical protein
VGGVLGAEGYKCLPNNFFPLKDSLASDLKSGVERRRKIMMMMMVMVMTTTTGK